MSPRLHSSRWRLSGVVAVAGAAVMLAGGCRSGERQAAAPAAVAPSVVVVAAPAAPAPQVDWAGMKQITFNAQVAPNLANPHLDANADGWNLPAGYVHDPSGGRSGTGCLRYERTDPKLYPLATGPVQVAPGVRYRFGAWVRTENVQGDDSGGTVCLEYTENGKWLGGQYPHGIKGTTDWTLIQGSATIPDKPVQANLTLYMRRDMTGKVWFDDAFIEPEAARWNCYPVQPRQAVLTPDDGRLVLGSCVVGTFGDGQVKADLQQAVCRLQLLSGAQTVRDVTVVVKNERVATDLGRLPEGEYTLKATLGDPAHRWILAENTQPLRVAVPPAVVPPHACRVDARGRAWVDGKPFLPVGLYFGSIERTDLDRLAQTAFNCIMPYGSLGLKFKDSSKTGIEATREVLDACQAKNIKILFSIKDCFPDIQYRPKSWHDASGDDAIVTKAVEAFRDHPALLAWYICDELPAEQADLLIARTQLVNRLDPFHPTWAVFYQFTELPLYRNGFDVLGVDPYPIRDDKSKAMTLVTTAMDGCDRAVGTDQGLPVWVVPQIFNWGVYDAKAAKDLALYRERFRDPTEAEMRSMTLYMALRGARGFVFYSYFDLLKTVAPDQFERRWPEVCRVAQTTAELAPFLLADEAGPAVTVTATEGQVEAKAFTDGKGNVRVLIAGIGPGPAKAEIAVTGRPGLKSRFGACTDLGGGKYRFEGTDICSDILE